MAMGKTAEGIDMTSIRDILKGKGHAVWTIGPDATVYDAIAEMADKGIGALAVVRDEKIVGIVSERDYARKIILKNRSSREALVHEIMTPNVVVTNPDRTVEEGLAVMTDKRVRHLPVVEGGRLIGMVSIGDLTKSVISHQTFIIGQLEQYIRG
jgi:CBS domain-containing protein